MLIKEEELKIWYDNRGILTYKAQDKFLVSKGVIKLDESNQITVLVDSVGDQPYFSCVRQIENIIRNNKYKKVGYMGIDSSLIEKDVNKIQKIKDEIRAEDIDL